MKTFIFILTISILGLNYKFCNAGWQQTNGPYGGIIYAIDTSGTNIYAGAYYGGVFLSTDNGVSWKAVNNGLNISVVSLAISGANIFAGTNDGTFYQLIMDQVGLMLTIGIILVISCKRDKYICRKFRCRNFIVH